MARSPPITTPSALHPSADGASLELAYKGKVDPFPSFEMYARVLDEPDLPVHPIFQTQPAAGKGPLNLIGRANKPVSGTSVLDPPPL